MAALSTAISASVTPELRKRLRSSADMESVSIPLFASCLFNSVRTVASTGSSFLLPTIAFSAYISRKLPSVASAIALNLGELWSISVIKPATFCPAASDGSVSIAFPLSSAR